MESNMNFNHDLIDLPILHRIDAEDGRRYLTPDGNKYPSVTTVLGSTSDKSGLDDWKARIGEEAAYQEMKRAGRRGTGMHDLCERYIRNQNIDLRREMPVPAQLFSQVRPKLKEHVNNVRGIELPLYSDYLKIAGTADLIAEWDGKLAIIDYKSSNKNKEASWITDYWLQCSIYAICFEERTGIPINKLVVLMGVEQSTKPLVFESTRKQWEGMLLDRIKTFYKTNG
jgi:genome maintenance exonuclease 1